MIINVNIPEKQYPIIIEKGIIKKINEYIPIDKKILIITDENVPKEYLLTIKGQFKKIFTFVTPSGESAKSLKVYEEICMFMTDNCFTRDDIIIALGGGVIGDLSGFVASTFMRGIDFYSIPTTTLSQIDSSIGGKVAVNLGKYKNIIGSFHHPKAVFIDEETLKTLPSRHFHNGLVEAVKAGMIYDDTILSLFEKNDLNTNLEDIIYRSLLVKKDVVEKDETEQNLRKILNFGHTLGHGIESYYNLSDVLHGEAVAIGMIAFTQNIELKSRLINILKSLNLKTEIDYDKNKVYNIMTKDKKSKGDYTAVIVVKTAGKAEIQDVLTSSLINLI
ncbi:MAG: 3-dehydroquinate synthase [Oscillospiraceae bacterium]